MRARAIFLGFLAYGLVVGSLNSMAYELIHLLSYINRLKEQSGEEGKARLDAVTRDAKKLLEAYVNYSRLGALVPEEAEFFHACEKGITSFSRKIWWK